PQQAAEEVPASWEGGAPVWPQAPASGRPEDALPAWPGYEQRPDPSHAWLEESAHGPSPWATQPATAEPAPPPQTEVALDLGAEVDLPGLEATPEWMQPSPPSPSEQGSSDDTESFDLD